MSSLALRGAKVLGGRAGIASAVGAKKALVGVKAAAVGGVRAYSSAGSRGVAPRSVRQVHYVFAL